MKAGTSTGTEALPALEHRIGAGDVSLFGGVPTQTTSEDQRALLALQALVREGGKYANSTEAMLKGLARALPVSDLGKIQAFDADASEVNVAAIDPAPALCFIDGEHTNPAALSDFRFCLRVGAPDCVFAFHDDYIIAGAIRSARRLLRAQERRAVGMKLTGSVYVLVRGELAARAAARLAPLSQNGTAYFFRGALWMLRDRMRKRWPRLFKWAWRLRELLLGRATLGPLDG